jgi:hypothetical protein
MSPLLHEICHVILSGGETHQREGLAADDGQNAGNLMLTVAVTPDGHGDCLRMVAGIGQAFVEPTEEKMTLSALATKLSSSTQRTKIVSAADAAVKVFSRSTTTTTTTTTGRGDHNVGNTLRGDDGGPPPGKCAGHDDDNENEDDVDDDNDDVYYYSRQNDCLRTELPDHVWSNLHLPDTFAWAETAFGTGPPDAVNLWIGNAGAVSSMHKDHYENLFAVLAGGEKIFTLCPPADIAFLYEQPFPRGQFCRNTTDDGVTSGGGSWTVQMYQDRPVDDDQKGFATNDPTTTVPWIAADVTRRDDPSYLDQFPLLRHAHPVTVIVRPGELLYLPALWFHRVTQTAPTIAVNYWYDMRFDSPHWCYFHYLQTQAAAAAAAATKQDLTAAKEEEK